MDTSEEEISDETVKARFDKKRNSDLSICYKDLAVREYMDDFYEIIDKLRCMEEHEDLRSAFLGSVESVAESSQLDQTEIWKEFVCKAMDENAMNDDERKDYLIRFFSVTYCDKDFRTESLGINDLKYFGGF